MIYQTTAFYNDVLILTWADILKMFLGRILKSSALRVKIKPWYMTKKTVEENAFKLTGCTRDLCKPDTYKKLSEKIEDY